MPTTAQSKFTQTIIRSTRRILENRMPHHCGRWIIYGSKQVKRRTCQQIEDKNWHLSSKSLAKAEISMLRRMLLVRALNLNATVYDVNHVSMTLTAMIPATCVNPTLKIHRCFFEYCEPANSRPHCQSWWFIPTPVSTTFAFTRETRWLIQLTTAI